MRSRMQWDDVIGALQEVHANESVDIFDHWRNDVEAFVKMQMEFAQTAYEEGYIDAMDDIRDMADRRIMDVPATLDYLNE